ncbi:MAG: hypothetical protein ACI4LD_04580 [Lentihominibacter sp.]
MKKLISILSVVFILTALCACEGNDAAEPAEYSIGEMLFTVESGLSIDKESGTADTMCKENTLYAYKTFTGNSYSLEVRAYLAAYDNSSLDRYVDEVAEIQPDTSTLEDIRLGESNGKIGTSTADDKTVCVMYTLHNGFFYSFEAAYNTNEQTVREALQQIASTVKYDPSLIGEYSVTCGDLEYSISQKYALLDSETVETSYDEQWFATAGDSYTELGSLYFTDWENGYDVNGIAYLLTTELQDYEQTSEDGPLGTYTYITGKDAAGYNHIIVLFKYNDKSYCFNLFSNKEMSKDDIRPVLDTIKATDADSSSDTSADTGSYSDETSAADEAY